jgi:hypothetical protein
MPILPDNTPDNPFSQNFNTQKLQNFMQNNPFNPPQQDTQSKEERRAKLLALQKISGNQTSSDEDQQ